MSLSTPPIGELLSAKRGHRVSVVIPAKNEEPTIGAVQGQIVLLVLIILFIQRRPRGLFAQKGRAVEA